MDKKLFGKRVNAARKEQKLTGEKLAEACNINATYLRQIEGGMKLPSLPVFVTLCRELKASPSYLLADALGGSGAADVDIVYDLIENATPSQMRMITAMIHGALEALEREKTL